MHRSGTIDPPVEVLADGLLPTVFTNLIGNAVKFGGPDVEITVRVEERDGEVLVSVEDTGPGVPDEVKAKLFHRFERGMARGKRRGARAFHRPNTGRTLRREGLGRRPGAGLS